MEAIRPGLTRVIGKLLQTQPRSEAALLAWPLICGSEVASRTRAVTFKEGRLIVEVPDTGWRGQLSHLAPAYVTRLTDLLGPLVNEVRFQVHREGK